MTGRGQERRQAPATRDHGSRSSVMAVLYGSRSSVAAATTTTTQAQMIRGTLLIRAESFGPLIPHGRDRHTSFQQWGPDLFVQCLATSRRDCEYG